MPSFHRRIKKEQLNHIMDKIDKHLEGWKVKQLSLAGRVILSQAVLNAISFYTMQSTNLPRGICENVERKVRQFIWGGSRDQCVCSLVKRDNVTKPKDNGGLGIRRLRDMNKAFMAKLGWKLLTKQDKLWVHVFRAKYMNNKNGITHTRTKQVASNAWRGIIQAIPLIEGAGETNEGNENIYWRPTNTTP